MATSEEELLQCYRIGMLDKETYEAELAKLKSPPMPTNTEESKAEEYYQKYAALVKRDEEFFGLPNIPDEDMPQALAYLREAAFRGHILASTELGVAYLNGLGVPKDWGQAEVFLRKAAAAGEPNAQYWLYFILARQAQTQQDYQEAFRLLNSSAEKEFPAALFELGALCFNGQDALGFPRNYGKAAHYWQRAAKFGVSEATGQLALLYLMGEGVEKNPQKGLALLKETAEAQGLNMQAWYNLGALYLGALGIETGIPVNYSEALKWLTKAAEYGNLNAYHNIGVMYRDGLGVEKDDSKALNSFLMAAGFDPDGDEIETEGLPIVPAACYEAGKMLCRGEGIDEADEETGISLLEKAAELGVEEAAKLLEAIEKYLEENE
jgi:TPR repeat protein